MTKQESFKRRIRARMAKTGERYGAARRVLIEQATGRRRVWVATPELSEETVRDATGRGWEDWCDAIDAWPGRGEGHTAIARHLRAEHGLDGWWAQTVTIGYERITGLRLKYQQPDGTFTAGRSKTVRIDASLLREMLLDPDDRDVLFPDLPTELRSRPTSKSIRIAIGEGVALFALDTRDDGRTTVSVAHERLPTADATEAWRAFWAEWLATLDETD